MKSVVNAERLRVNMTEITRIRQIFKDQIEWYKKMKVKENGGEIDDSYIYDEAWNQFSDLKRGDLLDVLEILAND